MNIYVGNLAPKIAESQLRACFGEYGAVGKISMEKRPGDGSPHNFCFIEMPDDEQALLAIKELNGTKLGGYLLTVRQSGISI